MIEPGYYRVIKEEGFSGDDVKNGDIAICTPDKDGGISIFLHGTHYLCSDVDEFYDEMAFEPRGEEILRQRISEAMDEVSEANRLFAEMSKKLVNFTPHVGEDVSSSNALVSLGGGKLSADKAKRAVSEMRNEVARTKKAMMAKTKKLELLVEQQSQALAAKAAALGAVIKKAEQAIWSINLYLGKDEQVVQLAEGEPADQDEKIKFRQLVLYMDEECAMATDQGGIDVESIQEFDEWIVSLKHMQQVIPETKCVVALHCRRHKKTYADPWTDVQLNAANQHWTYFLIRNGDNLYRIYTDIVLGEYMFPAASEFDDIFRDEWDDKVIRPGSRQYMKCLERMEARQQHYLRILLIIQGIIDRTDIFKPLPGGLERINVCDRAEYDEYLEFIYDGQNLLGDGHPGWSDWLRDINSKIDIGCRVIGRFNDYGTEFDNDRIYPRLASRPEANQLHTIEAKSRDAFVIRYKRGDTVWTNKWGEYDPHEAKVRARCLVYSRDTFLLNFDAVSIKDCEYYINSRTERQHYMSMIPLLRTCIKLKRREAREEAPFRRLLVGEIIKAHTVSREVAEEHIGELISWWKFKNRTHRALTSDDSRALRMIVSEFKTKLAREAVREDIGSTVKGRITAVVCNYNSQQPVMIAHKSGNKYVAYVPHNEFNVWVTEQVWTHNRTTDEIYLSSNKEWRLVDKRHIRWKVIHCSDRWEKWTINPRRATVLTDSEVEEVVSTGLKLLDKQRKERRFYDHWHSRKKTPRLKIMAVTMGQKFDVRVYFSDFGPDLPKRLLYSGDIREPSIARCRIYWERKASGLDIHTGEVSHIGGIDFSPGNEPWSSDYFGRRYDNMVLRYDKKTIDLVESEFIRYEELKDAEMEIEERYEYAVQALKDHVQERDRAALFHEYIAEHGDPELWEDHLKEYKKSRNRDDDLFLDGLYSCELDHVCCLCAERDIDIIGKTVQEVFNIAAEFGYKHVPEDTYSSRRGCQDDDKKYAAIPLDFVIPPPPPPEPDEEEEPEEIPEEPQNPVAQWLDPDGNVICEAVTDEVVDSAGLLEDHSSREE